MSISPLLSRLLIIFLLCVGVFLRVHNLSIQKIYPDSYQSLITATFIQQYHSVVGYLGEQGMVYPDFFAWTRPGYPLIILFANFFTHNLATAAQAVSLMAGMLSLLLAFFLGKTYFKSNVGGICTMILLALSFNHIVWGGFILTEGFAVCMLLLFLLLLLLRNQETTRQTLLYDITEGLLAGYLILTRYEYALLLVPLGIYILFSKKYTIADGLYLSSSILFPIVLAGSTLFPTREALLIFFNQSQDILTKSLLVLLSAAGICLVMYRIPKTYRNRYVHLIKQGSIYALWVSFVYFLLQYFFPTFLPPGYFHFSAVRNFITDDIFLTVCFLIGATNILNRGGRMLHTLCLTLSLLLLYAAYFRTNPEMERYITHLIPFLLLPATNGLYSILQSSYLKSNLLNRTSRTYPQFPLISPTILTLLILLLICTQAAISWQGIRKWGDRTWFQTSYDEKAAQLTNQHLSPTDHILLASFPEPYYFVTKKSTYSLTDTYPYIYIPPDLSNQPLIISEDMGMRDLFPHFSVLLDKNLQDKAFAHFLTHTPYHYGAYSKKETKPIILYRTTVTELKDRIEKDK